MPHSPTPLTVTDLNEYIKSLLESNPTLKDVWVTGELSSVKYYTSGHMYFSLKDESSVISAVMFRGAVIGLTFKPQDGMKVLIRGKLSAYTPRGQYQLVCDHITPEGAGNMAVAFEQLKQKLAAEGLFDKSRKKPIPKHPKRIGIITSPSGAAVHDIIRVAKTRYKGVELLIFPALVQGEKAALGLASGVRYFNKMMGDPIQGVDVIIIGRGGGSMEDLWCFNDENLARQIASSVIPVVSAVGHEVDFTICDFVADLRAATPSAAAEATVPDVNTLIQGVDHLLTRLQRPVERRLSTAGEKLKRLAASRVLTSPDAIIARRYDSLDTLSRRLSQAVTYRYQRGRDLTQAVEKRLHMGIARRLDMAQKRVMLSCGKLESLSPLAVLGRGYAMAQNREGQVMSRVADIQVGDKLTLRMSDGHLTATVDTLHPHPKKGNES